MFKPAAGSMGNFSFARYDAPVMPQPVSAGAEDIANGVTDKKDGPVKMRSQMCVRKDGPIDCLAPSIEGIDFIFKPKLELADDEKPPAENQGNGGRSLGGLGGMRAGGAPGGLGGMRPGFGAFGGGARAGGGGFGGFKQ